LAERRCFQKELPVEQPAITILNAHRIMAISTVRPDGWPQTTFVGYANEGFDIFFMIFRSSQKFANIQRDDRVSIAVGEKPESLREIKAVYAAAHAREVIDPKQRKYAWRLLAKRHPNLAAFDIPKTADAALMQATCKYVSMLDFGQGFGHAEQLIVGDGGDAIASRRSKDDWASSAAAERKR
jgi:nitroimidazol reductase NimA-like FMN-containing flavoprotein (pyridoxamine 5'-phosphate oxidase superfamily)